MADDDVRVPAGWYPDPLGLPQLRWWDNHSWTEHTSDARQPMVDTSTPLGAQAQTATTAPRAAQARATSGPRLVFADDLPFADDLADYDGRPVYNLDDLASTAVASADLVEPPAVTGAAELPSRRALREAERLAHDDGFHTDDLVHTGGLVHDDDLAHGDDVVRDLVGDTARYGEPLGALEAPVRGEEVAAEPSPALRYAAGTRIDDAPRTPRYDLDESHEDLLGDTATPRSAFAHASSSTTTFIPDFPDEPVAEPERLATSPARRRAVAYAPTTSTVPGWLLTLIPVYMLLVGMIVLLGGADASFAPVTLGLVLGVPWVAGVVLAAIDHRMLRSGGMDRPAHWLWALLGAPVYLVARLVATVREAGTGFGPVLTYIVLGLFTVGAVIAVPGLAMELAPTAFSAEAERSITDDARSLGADLTIDCPDTPPMLVQQSFRCRATNDAGEGFDVLVSLQRSNGWIDWRVDDWGVFAMGS